MLHCGAPGVERMRCACVMVCRAGQGAAVAFGRPCLSNRLHAAGAGPTAEATVQELVNRSALEELVDKERELQFSTAMCALTILRFAACTPASALVG